MVIDETLSVEPNVPTVAAEMVVRVCSVTVGIVLRFVDEMLVVSGGPREAVTSGVCEFCEVEEYVTIDCSPVGLVEKTPGDSEEPNEVETVDF